MTSARARVAVVGGGISGLAAAWALADAGADVVVLEASDRVGGKLRTDSVAGISVDVGAEAMLRLRPEGLELATTAGLGDALLAPLTTSAGVRVGGAIHSLPARTMLGIPGDVDAVRASGALTAHAVSRIADEPSLEPLAPLTSDVSVGSLVRGRLGNEVADRLVEPLLGGVYAGRVDELSLHATMPALFAALQSGGSLVRAAASVARGGTRTSEPARPVFASLPGGLGRLPTVLASAGRFEVRTGVTVHSIRRTTAGFALDCGPVPEPVLLDVDGVVLAAPPAKSARLLRPLVPRAGELLAQIPTASVAIVTFAFRDVELPAGSGLLVGSREGLTVKGVTISSHKWPIETGGLTLLRTSLGRAGDEVVLQRDDDELIALARHDLQALLGVAAEPVDALVTRWGGGLPQYTVGHLERVASIRSAVAQVPGLAVCGASYDGVGIPACIATARDAAAQVLAGLARGGQSQVSE